MFIPSRREKRNETLRVSDLMSLRGTAASTTASVRGTHLMADECCFANSAPCAGPICGANSWPYGITVPLVLESKFDLASHVLARSLFVQPNPCTEQVPWAPPAFQARIGHRTRTAESKPVSSSSRTYSDSDPCADRTARSKNCPGVIPPHALTKCRVKLEPSPRGQSERFRPAFMRKAPE